MRPVRTHYLYLQIRKTLTHENAKGLDILKIAQKFSNIHYIHNEAFYPTINEIATRYQWIWPSFIKTL